MSNDNDIRQGKHCVFKMHVHLVFVAKYRRRVFDSDAINRLRTIFDRVCADFKAQLIEMDGEDDHVHLLVEYPPKVAVSNLVNSLKGVSSRLLRKERPDIEKRYWKGVLWSPSYFASSCGGAPISIVRQYIEQQPPPINPKDGYAVRAILPCPERRGLPRTGSVSRLPEPVHPFTSSVELEERCCQQEPTGIIQAA